MQKNKQSNFENYKFTQFWDRKLENEQTIECVLNRECCSLNKNLLFSFETIFNF